MSNLIIKQLRINSVNSFVSLNLIQQRIFSFYDLLKLPTTRMFSKNPELTYTQTSASIALPHGI